MSLSCHLGSASPQGSCLDKRVRPAFLSRLETVELKSLGPGTVNLCACGLYLGRQAMGVTWTLSCSKAAVPAIPTSGGEQAEVAFLAGSQQLAPDACCEAGSLSRRWLGGRLGPLLFCDSDSKTRCPKLYPLHYQERSVQTDYMALWQALVSPGPTPSSPSGLWCPEAPDVLLLVVLVAHRSEVGSWCPGVSK